IRARREEQRRDKQRQEVIKKHLEKAAKDGQEAQPGKEPVEARPSRPLIAADVTPQRPAQAAARASAGLLDSKKPRAEDVPKPSRAAAVVGAAAAALKAASARPTPPPAIKRPPPTPSTPSLPLSSEPEKLPAERKRGAFIPPPLALRAPPNG